MADSDVASANTWTTGISPTCRNKTSCRSKGETVTSKRKLEYLFKRETPLSYRSLILNSPQPHPRSEIPWYYQRHTEWKILFHSRHMSAIGRHHTCCEWLKVQKFIWVTRHCFKDAFIYVIVDTWTLTAGSRERRAALRGHPQVGWACVKHHVEHLGWRANTDFPKVLCLLEGKQENVYFMIQILIFQFHFVWLFKTVYPWAVRQKYYLRVTWHWDYDSYTKNTWKH